jgi:spermidine synthase
VDVAEVLQSSPAAFDAVLLDVDNGPTPLTSPSNNRLYDNRGVAVVRASLKPGGVLAVWSTNDDRRYESRLRTAGFAVRREHVRAFANRGQRYTIFLATLPIGEAAAR